MSERVILTIATGHPDFGEMCLNLALSIKANNPNQKVGLIYTDDAIENVKELVNNHFDYGLRVFYDECKSPAELSFKLKTQLYDLGETMCPEADAFIFLDADTIILPSKKPSDWFEEHAALNFTAYCNDQYYFATQSRKRKDYTFWCEPEKAKVFYGLHKGSRLPQVNSSFLYWKKSDEAKKLFDTAKELWESDFDGLQTYRGAKPDEFCFNVACAITGTYPHKNTYRPIFFQCFSENYSVEYVMHYFKSFGFAGNTGHQQHLIDLYNEHSNYYREHFAIRHKWNIAKQTKAFVDPQPLRILPFRKRTLYRQSELPNSDGGSFNPDGLVLPDGSQMTIVRKEKDMEAYKKGVYSTAYAHVHMLRDNKEEDFELIPDGYEARQRLEDFRLFMCGGAIFCNHSVVTNNFKEDMSIHISLAYIQKDRLVNVGMPSLPIATNRVEKNWAFFGERDIIWCIYSLQPYRLFYATAESGWGEWFEYPTEQVEIDFAHKAAISNSTNPILIGKEYLMFFHTKEQGIYYKGAVIINAETKQITHYTKHTIPFPARNDGWQRGLHYVSGAVYLERQGTVRLYYGENDSHAGYFDYNANELLKAIKQ